MVFGKVERREHVPVVFDFRTFGYGEAETREYGDDFVLDKRQRMTRTQRHRYGRAAQVEIVIDSVSVFESLAQSGQTVGGHGLELVELLSELALLLGGHIAEILHESCDGPLFAQIFDAESLDLLRSGGCHGLDLSLELIYLINHI